MNAKIFFKKMEVKRWVLNIAWLSAMTMVMVTFNPAMANSNGPMQSAIHAGKKLFTEATFGGNGMNCASCHRDAGRGPTILPNGKRFPSIADAAARFPRYNSRSGKVITLEDQIRHCVRNGLGGTPPAYGGRKMNELVAYLTSLAQGVPIDINMHQK